MEIVKKIWQKIVDTRFMRAGYDRFFIPIMCLASFVCILMNVQEIGALDGYVKAEEDYVYVCSYPYTMASDNRMADVYTEDGVGLASRLLRKYIDGASQTELKELAASCGVEDIEICPVIMPISVRGYESIPDDLKSQFIHDILTATYSSAETLQEKRQRVTDVLVQYGVEEYRPVYSATGDDAPYYYVIPE